MQNRTLQILPTAPERNSPWFILGIGAAGVAGTIALPAVILPWVWVTLDAPLLLIGLVIPLIQGGRLIAPVLALQLLSRLDRRKWLLVLCCLLMTVSLVGLALLVQSRPEPPLVVGTILLMAFLTGVARGIGRFGQREAMARALPRESRGGIISRADSVAGWLALFLAFLFSLVASDFTEGQTEMLHLLVGIGFWTLGMLGFGVLFESSDVLPPKSRMLDQLRRSREILRTRPSLRQFMILRLLLLSLDLSLPFYTVHAAAVYGIKGGNLSLIVLCTATASILQGPFWAKRLDRSARSGIGLALSLAALSGLLLIGVELFKSFQHPSVHGIAFLLIGMAALGGLNARNLLLVELATNEERPVISAGSTLIAGVIGFILGGLLGIVAHHRDVISVIVGLVVLQIGAGLYTVRINAS